MKRLVIWILLLATMAGLTSCTVGDAVLPSDVAYTSDTQATCRHLWKGATCDSPLSCIYCGETWGNALGHNSVDGICSRCFADVGDWKIEEFHDEFKRPIGVRYVIAEADGVFGEAGSLAESNLYAGVQVTPLCIEIILLRNGDTLVPAIPRSNQYNITVLDHEGQKHHYSGRYNGGISVSLESEHYEKLLDLLRRGGELSFYLRDVDGNHYLFTIKNEGFSRKFAQID